MATEILSTQPEERPDSTSMSDRLLRPADDRNFLQSTSIAESFLTPDVKGIDNRIQASTLKEDEALRILSLARRTHMPKDYVARNADNLELELRRGFNPADHFQYNQNLASWAAESPANLAALEAEKDSWIDIDNVFKNRDLEMDIKSLGGLYRKLEPEARAAVMARSTIQRQVGVGDIEALLEEGPGKLAPEELAGPELEKRVKDETWKLMRPILKERAVRERAERGEFFEQLGTRITPGVGDIPSVGGFATVALSDTQRLIDIQRRYDQGQPLTASEAEFLQAAAERQVAEENQPVAGVIGGGIGRGLKELVKYGAEMYLTKGVFRGVRTAVEMSKLARIATGAAEGAAIGWRARALKYVSGTAAAAVAAPLASPGEIYKGYVESELRAMDLTTNEVGQVEVVLDEMTDDGALERAVKAYGRGAIAYWTETMVGEAASDILKPIKAALFKKWVGKEAVGDALAQARRFQKAASDATWWNGFLEENIEEVVEPILNSLLLGDEYHLPTLPELVTQTAVLGVPTIGGAALRGAARARDRRRESPVMAAVNNALFVRTAIEKVQEQALATRSPEDARELVDKMTTGEMQYMDPNKVQTMYQTMGLDAHAEVDRLTGVPGSLASALETQTPLSMPLASVILGVKREDKALVDFFARNLRREPGTSSLAEVEDQVEAQATKGMTETEKAARLKKADEGQAELEAYLMEAFKPVVASGRISADEAKTVAVSTARQFRTLSLQEGRTPLELAQTLGVLSVHGVQNVQDMERIAQARVQELAAGKVPTAEGALAAVAPTLAPTWVQQLADLRAMDEGTQEFTPEEVEELEDLRRLLDQYQVDVNQPDEVVTQQLESRSLEAARIRTEQTLQQGRFNIVAENVPAPKPLLSVSELGGARPVKVQKDVTPLVATIADTFPQSRHAGKIPVIVKASEADLRQLVSDLSSLIRNNPDQFPVVPGSPFLGNPDYGITFTPTNNCPKGDKLSREVATLRAFLEDAISRKSQEEQAAIKTAASRKLLEASVARGLETPCLQCYTLEKRITGYTAKPISRGQKIYKPGQADRYVDGWKERGGMIRAYGTADFTAMDIVSWIQFLTDLQRLGGLGVGAYTKNLSFLEVFGDTGIKFNISVGSDLSVGIPVEVAKQYTARYPNAAMVAVSINDADLRKFGENPDVHLIIPAHLGGGTPASFLSEITGMEWQSRTSGQNEKIEVGGKSVNLWSPAADGLKNIDKARKIVKHGTWNRNVDEYLAALEKASKLLGQEIHPKFEADVKEPWYGKLIGSGPGEYGKTADIPKLDVNRTNTTVATNYFLSSNEDLQSTENKYASMARRIGKVAKAKGVEGIEKLNVRTLHQSLVPDSEQVQPFDEETLFQPGAPMFSQLQRTLEAKMPASATVEQVRGIIKDQKADEIKWSGIEEFLAGKEKVSKQELLDFLRANELQIKVVTLGAPSESEGMKAWLAVQAGGLTTSTSAGWIDISGRLEREAKRWQRLGDTDKAQRMFALSEEATRQAEMLETPSGVAVGATKFSTYQLPGGTNYREVLFALPGQKYELSFTERGELRAPDFAPGDFRAGHFDTPNVLAHVRLNDRIDADGKRVLFVEEVQSDWHQKGREQGYAERGGPEIKNFVTWLKDNSIALPGAEMERQFRARSGSQFDAWKAEQAVAAQRAAMVPDAPFRKSWHEFVMKRVIRMAAEGGYDRVAWTTGEQQAERYDMSKHVSEIHYSGTNLVAYGFNGEKVVNQTGVQESELADYIGKDVAEKLLAQPKEGTLRTLLSDELKIISKAGVGQKGFYDKIIPQWVNKFAKKWGGKVGETEIIKPSGEGRLVWNGLHEQTGGDIHAFFEARKLEYPDAHLVLEKLPNGEYMIRSRTLGDKVTVHSLDITTELREAAVTQGFPMFHGTKERPRGAIKIASVEEANVKAVMIFLTPNRNRSTLLHEMSHLFFSTMEHLVETGQASERTEANYETLLKWVGSKPGEELTNKQRESMAAGWEAYILEGKSPSLEMAAPFRSMTQWLTRVYRTASEIVGFDTALTPEVRSLFDHLLATEEEIAKVQAIDGMSPMFRDPEAAGLSPERAAKMQAVIDEAADATHKAMLERALKAEKAKESAKFKEMRGRIWEAEAKKYDQSLGVRARALLATGTQPDGSPLPPGLKPFKLSAQSVLALPDGAQWHAKLPGAIMSFTGGVTPEVAAGLLGYESTHEFLVDMSSIGERQAEIDAIVNMAMATAYQDPLVDGTLHEKAIDSIYTKRRASLLRMEWEEIMRQDPKVFKAVAGRVLTGTLPDAQELKDLVQRTVEGMPFRDVAKNSHKYQQAEQQYGRAAVLAVMRGDMQAAVDAKRAQLINHELYRRTSEILEANDKFQEQYSEVMRGTSDKELAKTRDVPYVKGARVILGAWNIGTARKEAVSWEFLGLLDEHEHATYQALMDDINHALMTAKDWREATWEELASLNNVVMGLWELSRSRRVIELDGKQVELDKVRGDILTRTGSMSKEDKAKVRTTQTAWKSMKLMLTGMFAKGRRMEHYSDAFDGGDIRGPMSALHRQVATASYKLRDDKVEYNQKLIDILTPIEGTLNRDRIEAPELLDERGRMFVFQGKGQVLMAMLHTGNESSLRKLLLGWNWGSLREDGSLDTSAWDRFVERMIKDKVITLEDMQAVQGVWDLLDTLKPGAQRAIRRIEGRYFAEIKSREVTNSLGRFRGGYFPAMPDPKESTEAKQRSEEAAIRERGQLRASTGNGFTKGRVEFNRPLILDIRSITTHVDSVLRYTHLQPVITDITKVFHGSREFRAQFDKFDPHFVNRVLVPWLVTSAAQRVETPGTHREVDWIARQLLRNGAGNQMFGNVSNTLTQATGILIANVKVDAKHLAVAGTRYSGAMLGGFESYRAFMSEITSRSSMMRQRLSRQMDDTTKAMHDLLLNPRAYDTAKAFFDKHKYVLQSFMQNQVDIVTWVGAYNQALLRPLGDSRSDVETWAALEADRVVRETQGSFMPEDVSAIEVGSPLWRAFIQYQGYFNSLANLQASESAKALRNLPLLKGAGRLFYIWLMSLIMPAASVAAIQALMRGIPPDEEDNGWMDEYLSMVLGEAWRSMLQEITVVGPGVRTLVGAGASRFLHKVDAEQADVLDELLGVRPDDKVITSPAVRMLDSAFFGSIDAAAALVSGKEITRRQIRGVMDLAGLLSGLPVGAFGKPAGFLYDVSQEVVEPEGVIDYARGLTTGTIPKE